MIFRIRRSRTWYRFIFGIYKDRDNVLKKRVESWLSNREICLVKKSLYTIILNGLCESVDIMYFRIVPFYL